MFTWRELSEGKTVNKDYINNILKLINNKILIKELIENNITTYISFHHQIPNNIFIKSINRYFNIINENELSNIMIIANLCLTDFSSIIFDFIYREKPFVLFIPYSNYSQIKINYNNNYYQLIKDLRENIIHFENIFFNVNETIDKIKYYIKNDFHLEKKMKIFYESFGFKKDNSIFKFIEYIKKLK